MRLGVLRCTIITLALTLSSAAPLFAQTAAAGTSMSGAISGHELCAQDMCGSAIFAALFAGQIDARPAVGLAIGAIRHTPLPTTSTDPCAIIVGGSFAGEPSAAIMRHSSRFVSWNSSRMMIG